MKIVIVGLGKIGTCIVKQLTNEQHEVVCIDSNQENVASIINQYDVMGIKGNGSDFDVLKEADVKNCDLFIAATSRDEDNIVCCILARKLGAKKTFARIRNPEFHKHIEFLKDELDIDYPLNPEYETACVIDKIISLPSALTVDSFAKDKADIIAYTIKEGSPLINLKIRKISKQFEGNVLFISVQRNNETFIPNGDFELQEKDVLYILGERNEIVTFLDSIGSTFKKLKKILIIGVGLTGAYLINKLIRTKHIVKVIENNKNRCEELNKLFPNISIINADGTDQEVLIREGINECDAVVSLANLDEENIMIGMFAQRCGVKKIITKVNKDSLSNMIQETTDMTIISAKEVTADIALSITRQLTKSKGSKVINVIKLIEDQIEAIQFDIHESFKYQNTPLKDLKIKENNIIGCILRDDKVIIPNGNDIIMPNDKVMIITKDFKVENIEQIMK